MRMQAGSYSLDDLPPGFPSSTSVRRQPADRPSDRQLSDQAPQQRQQQQQQQQRRQAAVKHHGFLARDAEQEPEEMPVVSPLTRHPQAAAGASGSSGFPPEQAPAGAVRSLTRDLF